MTNQRLTRSAALACALVMALTAYVVHGIVADSMPMDAGFRVDGARVTVSHDEGSFVGVHGVPEQSSLHHLRRLTLSSRTFEDLVVARSERGGKLGRDVLGDCAWLLHGPRRELWLLGKQ